MQSYIRPVSEGIVDLRALMKSALPLLITTPASKDPVSEQVWGKLVWPILSSTRSPLASCGGIPYYRVAIPSFATLWGLIVKAFSW